MNNDKIDVLIIDDDPGDVFLIQERLKECASGIEFASVSRLADAKQRLDVQQFDLVLIDLNLPDSLGVATAVEVLDSLPKHTASIVLSGSDDKEDAFRVGQHGGRYLHKDSFLMNDKKLLETSNMLGRALWSRKTRNERDALRSAALAKIRQCELMTTGGDGDVYG